MTTNPGVMSKSKSDLLRDFLCLQTRLFLAIDPDHFDSHLIGDLNALFIAALGLDLEPPTSTRTAENAVPKPITADARSRKQISATPRTSHNVSAHDPDLLTVEQAAAYLNVTVHGVRRMIQERRIPFVRVGRLIRLRRQELDTWLDAHHVAPVRRYGATQQRKKETTA